jgi:MFS transporter, DHA1 family, inner membrane transport protein
LTDGPRALTVTAITSITGNQVAPATLTGQPVGPTSQAGTSQDCLRRRSRRAVFALAALSLAAFAYVTTESLPIGLLLPMSKGLRAPEPAIGLLVTAYGAVVVVASVPLTLLTQRLPRRLVLCCVLAAFVVSSVSSAAAPTYGVLLGARVVTALSQALFWALVIPTAAGLASPGAQGRAVAAIFGGVSMANVAGVPGATWLGQVGGWRLPFIAISALAMLALVAAAALLPTGVSGSNTAQSGASPDRRRFRLVLAVTALVTTGSFMAYTYLAPFLAEVAHLAGAAMGPVLLARGAAGVLGVFAAGFVVGRRPGPALIVPVAAQAVALIGLFALGQSTAFAVGLVAVTGFAFAAFTATLGSRVMEVAPGSVDLASAAVSTAVNLGISAGSLSGGLLLSAAGARSTVLVGGVLSAAALALALRENPRPSRAPRRRQWENVAVEQAPAYR